MTPRGTTLRNIRIDDERWETLGEAARAAGTDRSAIIRAMIDVWLESREKELMRPPPSRP